MKIAMLSFAVAAACCATFMFAPHHKRKGELFRPCTLGESCVDFVRHLPELLVRGHGRLFLLAATAIGAIFFPQALLLMIWWLMPPPGQPGGAIFVLAGILCIVGAVANFVSMLGSHMSFGFGVSSESKDHTAFLFLIPALQISFAIASIVIGVSVTCARCASRMIAS